MITKWCIANFKSIRDETELDFAPLTIFAGPNSSGKSTIIQSLLLISQTLISKLPSRSVILNGHLTRLGAFNDIRNYGSDYQQIMLRWHMEPHHYLSDDNFSTPTTLYRRLAYTLRSTDRLKEVSCEVVFDSGTSMTDKEQLQLQPMLLSCHLSAITEERGEPEDKSSLSVVRSIKTPEERSRELHLELTEEEPLLSSLVYEISEIDTESKEQIREDRVTAEAVGCLPHHFLPVRITVCYDENKERARQIAEVIVSKRRPLRRNRLQSLQIPPATIQAMAKAIGTNWENLLRPDERQAALFEDPSKVTITVGEWQDRLMSLSRDDRITIQQSLRAASEEIEAAAMQSSSPRYALAPSYTPVLTGCAAYIDTYFSDFVQYLGPLRDEPKALYPLETSAKPKDVGIRGEHTAAVLDLHKDKIIQYIPSARFDEKKLNKETTAKYLKAAVVDWLRYMGIAHDVSTRDRGKLGHELKVTTEGVDTLQDLTHVGVGVSQVLPIVVMCLLADKDSLLIFEQPELHLHPKVQTRLADFFLSIALQGKQCIVESHSEYLISRLRYRIAADMEDSLNSIAKIYFVEKLDGTTKCRPIAVNRYGAIVDWPEGFFDQSQYEAEQVLRAATQKRKAKREEDKNA